MLRARIASLFVLIALFGAAITTLAITKPAFAGSDTYPSKWADAPMDTILDDWGEWNRECTSYAAWMLHSVNGFEMPFHDNAVNWGPDAKSRGYAVNMTPAVGSIYWTSSPQHVAWVESVSPDGKSVTIEDYNHDYTGHWGERTVATSSASGYIHFKDISWSGIGSAKYFGSDRLTTGQKMYAGQYLVSGNVQYALILQSDGNLVLYHGTGPLWASNTAGKGASYLAMQSDGNLVLYTSSGKPVWASNTAGKGGSYAVVQSDGNFVTYINGGGPTWASNTGGKTSYTYFGSYKLTNGQQMPANDYIRSSDNRYALLLQSDGNLVLYGPGYHVLWTSKTPGSGANRLVMQGDGNLVLYQNGTPKWASNTAGNGSSEVIMQNDGNLVVYRSSDGKATWASNTNGKI